MLCEHCGSDTTVKDTKAGVGRVRRVRKCKGCGIRTPTIEVAEEVEQARLVRVLKQADRIRAELDGIARIAEGGSIYASETAQTKR